MGCGMSTEEFEPPNPMEMEQSVVNALQEGEGGKRDSVEVIYKKIDEAICEAETECPGPRLTVLQSWLEHLEGLKITKLGEINENELNELGRSSHLQRRRSSAVSTVSATAPSEVISKSELIMILSRERSDTLKVRQIVNKLGVATDPVKAKQNEELLANISKTSLTYLTIDVLTTMIEHSKKRIVQLLEKYAKLKDLYSDLDGILTAVTGGSYVSLNEQTLDKQLESNRTIRDKLGAVSEQWRICSTLTQAASKSADQALTSWNLLMAMKVPSEKVALCLDCRQTLHNSIIALTEAQNALSQVDVPSISSRQLTEIQHTNQYLLSDMASADRSKQIKGILDGYHRNTTSALEWVHNTYQKTMLKNFKDAESDVQAVAKKLRSERLKFIGATMGRSATMSSPSVATGAGRKKLN